MFLDVISLSIIAVGMAITIHFAVMLVRWRRSHLAWMICWFMVVGFMWSMFYLTIVMHFFTNSELDPLLILRPLILLTLAGIESAGLAVWKGHNGTRYK